MSFILNPYKFKSTQPNTFIGGVGTTITTKSALADKFTDVSVFDIKSFKIIGSDVYAYIDKDITLQPEAFYLDSDITYFIHNSELYSCSSSTLNNNGNRSFQGSTIQYLFIRNAIRISGYILHLTNNLKAVHIGGNFSIVADSRINLSSGGNGQPDRNQDLRYFSIPEAVDVSVSHRQGACWRIYMHQGILTPFLRAAKTSIMNRTYRNINAVMGISGTAYAFFQTNFRYIEISNISNASNFHEFSSVNGSNSLIFRINDATSIPYRSGQSQLFTASKVRELHIPNVLSIGTSHSVVWSELRSGSNSNMKIYVHPSLLTANAGNMDATLQDWQDNGLATIIPVTNQDPPNPPTALYHDNYNAGTGEVEIHFTNPTAGTNAIEYYEVWATWKDEPIPVDFPEQWSGDRIFPDYWYFVQTIPASSSVVSSFTNDKNYKIKLRTKDILGNLSAFSDEITLTTH